MYLVSQLLIECMVPASKWLLYVLHLCTNPI